MDGFDVNQHILVIEQLLESWLQHCLDGGTSYQGKQDEQKTNRIKDDEYCRVHVVVNVLGSLPDETMQKTDIQGWSSEDCFELEVRIWE